MTTLDASEIITNVSNGRKLVSLSSVALDQNCKRFLTLSSRLFCSEVKNYQCKHDPLFNMFVFNQTSRFAIAAESKPLKEEVSHAVILSLTKKMRIICGQSYKHFTFVNYDSRVVTWEIS